MPPSRHHPHDKLFRTVLADRDEAEGFLRAYLPETITNELDWQTLKLIETSFVDESLQDSESDVLYQIQHRNTEAEVLLYLLFEHQSVPDEWMRFRLHKYKGRIWDESFNWDPKQKWLPPVLPVVFYQGTSPWNYSTEFADLLPEVAREWPYVPHFSHVLIDQSGIGPDEVKGNLKAQVMQLLMLAAYHEPIQEILRLAARRLATVSTTGGMNYLYLFVHYVAATQERETTEEFVEDVQQQKPEIGDEMVTFAQELLQEGIEKGKLEGKIEGKIEMIEKLLALESSWSFIEQVTGVNQVQFEELKQQLAELQQRGLSQPDQSVNDA